MDKLVTRETFASNAIVRNDECRNARHMRSGHRGSLHVTVLVVRERRQYKCPTIRIATRSTNIHPLTIAGEIRAYIVGTESRHSEDIVIHCRMFNLAAIVSGCENDQAPGHGAGLLAVLVKTGIGIEIIYGFDIGLGSVPLVIGKPPAAIDQHCTVVGSVNERLRSQAPIPSVHHLRNHYPSTRIR